MSEGKKNAADQIGTLSSCLIEGDPEQKARERKIKRRALAISIALQCAALVALVLVPLLGRTEKISLSIVTPMPPYRVVRPHVVPEHPTRPTQPQPIGFVFPSKIPHGIVTREPARPSDPPTGNEPNIEGTVPVPGIEGGNDLFGKHTGPTAPRNPNADQLRRVVRGGDVQQAMLVRRVQPSYPELMRVTRRSGKVELRALISTEGTIESLQVISGEPGFYESAMSAVKQWKYRPTYLNGQAVEVETIITVVYTLNNY